MHSLGNDFIILDGRKRNLEQEFDLPALARFACHRHGGVGGDGMICVLPSHRAEVRMRIFNPDGSEAETCGNGLRCLGAFVYRRQRMKVHSFWVEMLGGLSYIRVLAMRGSRSRVEVDLGEPRFLRKEIPAKGEPDEKMLGVQITSRGKKFEVYALSVGNPHCVIFCELPGDDEFLVMGPSLEKHPVFPNNTNVEFVEVISPDQIRMRVWERGVGPTLACGTGAAAATVAGISAGKLRSPCTVTLPGGELKVEWRNNGHIYIVGPTIEVFSGEIEKDLIYG
ncbi:MAG: diaminopimelate epimerase [Candidatus Eremiobacteraeota bacterium]|nr:diaminopimelate epimerase [Candidatus Eremiobacteraeota bacterium]